MRPRIGLEVDLERSSTNGRIFTKCYLTYIEAIWRAGGSPVLIAPIADDGYIEATLDALEGLVVPGGDDIDVRCFGAELYPCPRYAPGSEARLEFGRRLVGRAVANRLPFLGICYGSQLLNLVLGGSIVQDLADLRPGSAPHKSDVAGADLVHGLEVVAGSRLASILGEGPRSVNSVHHQAIDRPAPGFKVAARAPDGVVEAIEDPQAEFFMGVQWHPERESCGASGALLFEALVAASRGRCSSSSRT